MSDLAELGAPATPRSLFEFFPRYRVEHPIDDEVLRLTMVGFPVGALRRRTYRTVAVGVALIAVLIPAGFTVMTTVLVVMAALALATLIRPRCDLPIGVVVSNRRVVIAQQAGRARSPIVSERPAGSITVGTMHLEADKFATGGHVHRVALAGAAGEVVALELTNFDPDVTEIVLREAGLEVVRVEPANARPPTTWWLPKAFVVSVLWPFGALFALAGGYGVAIGSGMATAIVFVVGVVMCAMGEVLRRRFFRRRS